MKDQGGLRGGLSWAVPWWGGAYARTEAFRVGCAARPRGSCRSYATRSHQVRVRRVMATDNSLPMWAKSIAPHAEESGFGPAALVPGVNSDLRAAERGHGRVWCIFPSRKRKTNTSQYAGDRRFRTPPTRGGAQKIVRVEFRTALVGFWVEKFFGVGGRHL